MSPSPLLFRVFSSAFLLSTISVANAQEEKRKQALDALPVGATIRNFRHPAVGEDLLPSALLQSEEMEITSTSHLTGKQLRLWMFDENAAVETVAAIAEAEFLLESEQIHATDEVTLRSRRRGFAARGPRGQFQLRSQQVFLNGPAQTTFTLPDEAATAGFLWKSLLLQTLCAPPLAPLTADQLSLFEEKTNPAVAPDQALSSSELAQFDQKVVIPEAPPSVDIDQNLADAQVLNARLDQRLASFLTLTGQAQLLAQVAPTPAPEPEEDLFQPGPNRLVIDAEKGVYFDGENQEFAYLGRVRLAGRGMVMTCTNGVRALMEPAPDAKSKEKDGKKADKKDFELKSFGDLRQITANGSIVVKGTNDDGQPIEARADRALYDARKQELILRGKILYFRHGGAAAASQDPKAYLRLKILKSRHLQGELPGNWTSTIPLQDLEKKKGN